MQIAVVAAVVEHDGRFLVTRRQDGVHLAGMWEFPGGKIANGESHAAALRREMIEELDVDFAALVTTPISRSPLNPFSPRCGAVPWICSRTRRRATRPPPRCRTRMITSCPT